ncbi:MAG: hypothetical protein JWO06_2801, partial [Bacteroidota bacterium]|nr:hypothetical protein [Bacteroidota bacterium]
GGFDNDGDTYIKAVNEFGSCSQLAGFEPIPGNDNNKVRFQIYPNPTAEAIKVKINGDMASSIEYSIMSIDGKVIKAGATKENMFEFGTQQMANGIYVLSITDNNGSQGVQRFEVSR